MWSKPRTENQTNYLHARVYVCVYSKRDYVCVWAYVCVRCGVGALWLCCLLGVSGALVLRVLCVQLQVFIHG